MTTGSLASIRGFLTLLGDGAQIRLPFHEYVDEVSIELATSGAWTASITLFDPGFDALELAILAAERDRDVELQFGWDDPTESTQRTFKGWIVRYQPEFQPHGTNLTLEVMARSLGPAIVDKKIRSFAEGMRASDIVREIADDRGWLTSDLFGNETIEETDPPLETPFNTKGESDFNFIRDQLLKHARSKNGGSDYRLFFDEEGALHFHTASFIPGRTHLYRYARDIKGEVEQFAPTETALFGVLSGGGNAKFSSAVSIQGGTAQVSTTQAGGVNQEGTPTTIDSAAKPNLGDGVHSYVNLWSRNSAEVERIARARYEHYRRFAYATRLDVRGTHRAKVLDYARVEVIKSNGELHYLSGNFQIFKIRHTFSSSDTWKTSFDLMREGVSQQSGTEPIIASSTVTPEAPSDAGDGMVGLEVES